MLPGSPGIGRPPQLQDYLKAIDGAVRAGDMRRAMAVSGEAADKGFEHPNIFILAAYHNLNLNHFNKALDLATRARDLAPRNVDALNALGVSLTKLDRTREAIAVFDAALRQAPGAFITHFNKATALEQASELKRARDQFIRALSLQPNHAESMTHIAHMAAQRGDMAEARDYATRAIKLDPRQVYATFALATADLAEKNYTAVLNALTPITRDSHATGQTRGVALNMLGDALDGLGRHDEAFRAYTQAGDTFRAMHEPIFGRQSAPDLTRKLTTYFRAAPSEPWRNVSKGSFQSPVKTHVFLVSFPRSGTTLLGQVLAAHPDVESMEERSCLIDAHPFLLDDSGLDKLAAMDGGELDSYREAYWKRVAQEWEAPTKPVFIDKLPLNSVLLCLVAKLFPDAKILFALRDPRDVVLSCFRRRFGMTQQMYELLTLKGAASYYDVVMELCEVYREKLSLAFTDTRYETLVSDFDGETKRLCAFLDIEPDPGMADFAPKALARHIDTPSAAQVAQGLFTHGAGQWRPYREQLSPVLPILEPWIARYGYSKE